MILIDGKKAAAELRAELREEVSELKAKHNKVPGLTVILIGDLTPSQIYVRNKDKSANDNVPDPSVFKNWFADPSDVGNASPDNVACPETLNVPSTISPSLMLIDDESLELKVVPRTVIESNIIFPVPDVEIVKSEFVGATIFCIDMSPSLLNSSADPAAFTFRTWPAEPIAVKPVPPKEVPTVSPDWNSAIPVATLDALKTTRTGVLSAIS